MKNNKIWLLLIIFVLLITYYKWYSKNFSYEKVSLEELKQQIEFSVKQNRFPHAIQFLHQAIKLYPEEKELHYSLSHLYLLEEDFVAATKHIEIIIAHEKRSEYLILKGRIKEKEGNIQKAVEIFEQLKQQNYLPAYLALLDVYLAQYDIVNAKNLIQEIDTVSSEDINLHKDLLYLKAQVAIYDGKYEDAENILKEYLVYRPYVQSAHLFFIRVLCLQGKIPEAQKFYTPFLDNIKRADYLFYQIIYGNLLSPVEAEVYYQKIEEHSPVKYNYWLEHLVNTNQLEKAILVGKEAIKYAGNSPLKGKVTSYLGYAYLYSNQLEEAEKTFALLGNNNNTQYLYAKGLVTTKIFAGEMQKAKAICSESLEKNSDIKNTLRLQTLLLEVNYYLENFKLVTDEAIPLLRNMHVGMSEYAVVLELQAKSYLALKDYDLAASTFEKIYTLPTSLPTLFLRSYIWQGISLYLSGKKDDALQVWQKAKDIEWKNYVSDTRETEVLSLLISGEANKTVLSSIPLGKNDALFFEGIHYHLHEDFEKAQVLFQQGIQESVSKEFPYFCLQAMIK